MFMGSRMFPPRPGRSYACYSGQAITPPPIASHIKAMASPPLADERLEKVLSTRGSTKHVTEPTNNCLERGRFQRLPWFFYIQHLIIIYIFLVGICKSHVLNARLAPTINPRDVIGAPPPRCEKTNGEPSDQRWKERVFSAMCVA